MFGTALALGAGALILSVASADAKPQPHFTELWLIPQNSSGAHIRLNLGVTNHEVSVRTYRLVIVLGGRVEQSKILSLSSGQTWTNRLRSARTEMVVVDLYLGRSINARSTPYRQVTYSPPSG